MAFKENEEQSDGKADSDPPKLRVRNESDLLTQKITAAARDGQEEDAKNKNSHLFNTSFLCGF
jgi:hypothetical protein